jgi:hypothetical protein
MLREKLDGVVQPEQLRECAWVPARVVASRPHPDEARKPTPPLDAQHAPPFREQFQRMAEMPATYDEGRAVQDAAVHADLSRKPSKAVPVRLDLVAVEMPVDDREVHADLPATEAELFDEDRAHVARVRDVQALAQKLSDLCIGETRVPGAHRGARPLGSMTAVDSSRSARQTPASRVDPVRRGMTKLAKRRSLWKLFDS